MAWSRGAEAAVGVLGATSFVGRWVLTKLRASRQPESDSMLAGAEPPHLFAFSRHAVPVALAGTPAGVHWHQLPARTGAWRSSIPHWIACCPLWAVPEHFPFLKASGATRLVALSSTSRFTKRDSPSAAERTLAARLATAEEEVLGLARAHGIAATILRPTLIYDGIHDRNVVAIADCIRRFGFVPVAGPASGLRQPVHAEDVAAACQAAVSCDGLRDAYEISGGETLPYHEMVRRIFAWLGRPARMASIPMPLLRATMPLARLLPGLASMATMAARMNEDLVFDHGAATGDFGFQPRAFALPLRHDSNHAASIAR